MISPAEKTLIEDDCNSLVWREMGLFEKTIENACQATGMSRPGYLLPLIEIVNAYHDVREAREQPTLPDARRQVAFARRHFHRARLMLLGITVYGVERRIKKKLKRRRPRKGEDFKQLRRDVAQLTLDRRDLPKVGKAVLGGSYKKVNSQNVQLRQQCNDWGALLVRALELYKAIILPPRGAGLKSKQ